MRKKKVLVYGKLGGIVKFFSSNANNEYTPLAVVSSDADMLELNGNYGLPKVEVISPERLPKFACDLAEGILLVDTENFIESMNFWLQRGTKFQKIILWSESCKVKSLYMKSSENSAANFAEGLEYHLRDDADKNFWDKIVTYLQNQKDFFTFGIQSYPSLLKKNYESMTKKTLDWNNLQTWSEKLQLMKLCDSTALKSRLADKYLVRFYAAEKIGEEFLTPLLGVWNNFDEIDFESLPEKFLLQCNHAPSFKVLVEKKSADMNNLREKFDAWQQVDFGAQPMMEFHYSGIRRKIFAEKFMAAESFVYEFFCFDGKPFYCRHENIFFDMNWETENSELADKFPPPKNFRLLKKFAARLSAGFSFVSVNFKVIDGEIFFDKLDFTPGAGFFRLPPPSLDRHLGKIFSTTTPPPAIPAYEIATYEFRDHLPEKYSVRLKFAHKEKIIFPQEEPPIGRVIASLTSWTKRISVVHRAIETILANKRQPDLTVLYLADEEFPNREEDLPLELTELLSEKFEIRWTKNLGSHKKLIPALKDFPDDIIVTFDDDHLYSDRLIESFLDGYKKFPGCVQFQIGSMTYFEGKERMGAAKVYYDYPTHLHGRWGCGGALYPPHCLHKNVFDEEIFMKFFHNRDDEWIKIMLMLNDCRENFIGYDGRTGVMVGTQNIGINGVEKVTASNPDEVKKFTRENYPQVEEIFWQEWLKAKPTQ